MYIPQNSNYDFCNMYMRTGNTGDIITRHSEPLTPFALPRQLPFRYLAAGLDWSRNQIGRWITTCKINAGLQ